MPSDKIAKKPKFPSISQKCTQIRDFNHFYVLHKHLKCCKKICNYRAPVLFSDKYVLSPAWEIGEKLDDLVTGSSRLS